MGSKHRAYTDLLAAHNEVTGSNMLLVSKLISGETKKSVVDLGIFQEKENEKFNNSLIFEPKTIDSVFVTHAHADHIGRLPLLAKDGYAGRIFCSEDTKTLLPLALADSQKVQKTRAKRNNRPVMYDLEDVNETLKHVSGKEYNKWYSVDENTRFMLLGNGHLMGAAMIVLQIHDEDGYKLNLLFTGDYAPDNLFYQVPDIPEEILSLPLTVVTESTYGGTDTTDEAEQVFEYNVSKAAKKKKLILIPAFSLGRVQEVMYVLRCMQENGLLGKDIPIFLDGHLAIEYTRLFKGGKLHVDEAMLDFYPNNFHFVTTKEMREDLLRSDKQKIIITTSGMGTYGPAQIYIPNYIWNDKALIHFTGYCAEGTYGRKLKDSQSEEMFFSAGSGGLLETKKADVQFTSEFSKHAKADQLISLLKKFHVINSIIVNHGSTEAKKAFAERIYKEMKIKKIGVLTRNTGFRVGPYGIIKPLIAATDD